MPPQSDLLANDRTFGSRPGLGRLLAFLCLVIVGHALRLETGGKQQKW
jgi:hypothetical protein